jgi:hypothetical protein
VYISVGSLISVNRKYCRSYIFLGFGAKRLSKPVFVQINDPKTVGPTFLKALVQNVSPILLFHLLPRLGHLLTKWNLIHRKSVCLVLNTK